MLRSRAWWRPSDNVASQDDNVVNVTPFRVFNWNILAPQFVDLTRYRDVDPSTLCWPIRARAILEEIFSHASDIITLQEMDERAYMTTFQPILKQHEYEGVFVPKTPCPVDAVDGVATFWNTRRFKCLEYEPVKFCVSKVLNRPQVASIVVLQDKLYPDERLIVSNTHLLFNAKRGDVKLGQLQLLMSAIWRIVERHSEQFTVPFSLISLLGLTQPEQSFGIETFVETQARSGPGAQPKMVKMLRRTPGILMCGDYNTTPNSCIYEWLRSGRFNFASISDAEVGTLSGQYMMMNRSYAIDNTERCGRGTAPLYSASLQNHPIIPAAAGQASISKVCSDSALLVKNCRHHSGVKTQKSYASSPRGKKRKTQHIASECLWLSQIIRSSDTFLFTRPSVIWVPGNVFEAAAKREGFSLEGLPLNISSSEVLEGRESGSSKHTVHGSGDETARKTDVLYHPFRCCSAYAQDGSYRASDCSTSDERLKEPAFTAYHGWQRGCIDYIWYSRYELKVSRIFELPLIDELKRMKCIPHPTFLGSDHFSLVAELLWTPPAQRCVAALLYEL